ncbi:MAG: tetratricopeptide repeat protein [Candidatus Binatia bacterium]
MSGGGASCRRCGIATPVAKRDARAAASRRRWSHGTVLIALALAIGVAYANSFSTGFALDNRAIILDNPHLRAATAANVATLLTHDYWHPAAVNGLYRPLATLSYLFNYSVLGNGERPAGYHAVNLLLHVACAALVYALILQLGQAPLAAGLAAALFGLHPVATEAVTNIVGRADLLAALAVLAGLLCHVRATTARGAAAWGWRAALAASFLAGLLSKESAVVLPILILAWELVAQRPRRAGWASALGRDGWVLVPVLAGVGVARWWVVQQSWPAEASALDNPILAAEFWAGRATALKVLGLQLWTLAWPVHLSADYSANQVPLSGWPPDAGTLLSIAVVGALLGAVVWLYRRPTPPPAPRDRRPPVEDHLPAAPERRPRDRRPAGDERRPPGDSSPAALGAGEPHRPVEPALCFLILFYFVAVLPTANLIVPIGSIMADRFLYLPLVGFAGTVAVAAHHLAGERHRRTLLAASAVVLLACGWRTAQRNRDWTDDASLWASAVAAAPRSAKAHMAYAATLVREGAPPDLDGAIAAVRRALAIEPDYLLAQLDLGGYLLQQGDQVAAAQPAAAADTYREAVRVLEQARGLDQVGNDAFRQRMRARGVADDAIPDYGNVQLYLQLGRAQARLADFEAARARFADAWRLDPWNAQTAVDLAAVQAAAGRWDDAAASLFAALALDPDNRDVGARLVELYRHLGTPGAVIPDGAERVRLGLDAPPVRDHRCAGLLALAQNFEAARLPEPAARARRDAAGLCPPVEPR